VAQEAHTSPKSHHELNIWQKISLLKVKLPKLRHISQVVRKVSKEIKTLNTSGEQEQLIELPNFNMCSTLQS
jgi:hypothetical protein